MSDDTELLPGGGGAREPFSTAHADELKRLVHLEYEASKRRKRNRMVALVVALLDE